MPDVFISYARKDNENGFITRLLEALKTHEIDVWIDREDIPLSADWWQEICNGIDASNNFTAIISPNFVKSEVCRREVEYALQKNKRFVPVLYSELTESSEHNLLHPKLRPYNWVFIRTTDEFDKAVCQLVDALNTDLEYGMCQGL